MELTAILLRTTFMYFFIFLIMRMMGKREIGKLSVFDLVISIMIAEIAVIVIESTDRKIITAVAPILLLFIIQIGISYLSLKSRKLRLLFDGKPSVLIRSGHLNRKEMSKQRYNLDDLMTQLRENDVTEIEEVELAVLETTGKLSVITKSSLRESDSDYDSGFGTDSGFREEHQSSLRGEGTVNARTTEERNYDKPTDTGGTDFKFRYELLPMPLILDGQVQDDNLEKLGKTRFWLKSELQLHEVDNFKHVFFCSINHNGKLYVDKK
jgi:uncharacterized membrane protein YcaP (DUF421 family)